MGVQGTHSFLKKKGFSPEIVGTAQLKNIKSVHIDLLGSFFPLIANQFFKHVPSVAAKLILKQLGSLCSKEHTTLYLDSGITEEKETTSKMRRQIKENVSKKLESLLRVAEMKASQGTRVSASQIGAITRLSRRTFNLTSPMKDTLITTAKEMGWNITLCQGEADVHIGGLPLDENATVISGDSDLLFYPNVHNVLRPMGKEYHKYQKSDILALLNLTSMQWTCVGIVSGNDYDKNIKGLGITINHKLISEIQGNKIGDIISKYLKLERVVDMNVDKSEYSTSVRVFGDQHQRLIIAQDREPDQDISSQNQAALKARLLKIKQTIKKSRNTTKAAKGIIDSLQAKKKPKQRTNRFRPVERKRVGQDHKPSHPGQDRARYTFKSFTTFKSRVELKDGYKMYFAKEHVRPKDGEPDTNELKGEKEKKKKKKKKGKKRVKARPSGRSKRTITNDEAKPRTVNHTRKQIFALKKLHPVVILNVGDLTGNVRRLSSDAKFQEKILTTILLIVRIMSAAKKLAQLATDLLINYVMERFPRRESVSNQVRSKIFTPLVYGKDGGKVYQQNLLRLVISGQKKSTDSRKLIEDLVASDPENSQAAPKTLNGGKHQAMLAFNLLRSCYAKNQDYQSLDEIYGKLSLKRQLEMLSQVMDTELASHIIGRLPLLEAKVLEHTNGTIFPLDNASNMDDISKFHFTNQLLPEISRYAMTPQSGFKNNYIDITEEGLVNALGTSDEVKTCLKKAFEIMDSKVTKSSLRSAALKQKGVLITNTLFRLGNHKHGYSRTIRLLADEPSARRPYVLSGTFRTDGQVLQLVAIDTRKRKFKAESNDTSDIDGSLAISGVVVDKLLEDVESFFPDLEAVGRHFADPKKVTVIGIDLGERFTAAACGINSGKSDEVRNLAIKRSAIYQPTLQFRTELERQKPAAVRQAELAIPSKVKCTLADSSKYVSAVVKNEPILRSFYASMRFMRLAHDSLKARRGEFDVAANALLRMAGGHIGRKRLPDEDVLFAVGLGDFNTRTNLSSLHASFASHFISKVRSLGYVVVGVNEYYTSKKCPCCEKFVAQVTIRRLYCPSCQRLFHRDVMAGQNIANIAWSQLNNFCRPAYLSFPTFPTAEPSVSSPLSKRKASDEPLDEQSKKPKLMRSQQ